MLLTKWLQAAALCFRKLWFGLPRLPGSIPTRRILQVLKYGRQAEQSADLWLPAEQSPKGVVVLLHGGFWLVQYGSLASFMLGVLSKLGLQLATQGNWICIHIYIYVHIICIHIYTINESTSICPYKKYMYIYVCLWRHFIFSRIHQFVENMCA